MSDDDIRFVRGLPTDEELAAIVGVLFAARTGAITPPPAVASRWLRSSRPGYADRGLLSRPSPDAWRASSLPR